LPVREQQSESYKFTGEKKKKNRGKPALISGTFLGVGFCLSLEAVPGVYVYTFAHVASGVPLVKSLRCLQFLFLLLSGALCESYKNCLPAGRKNAYFSRTRSMVFSGTPLTV
jgi:hypothetical protein